MHNLITRIQKYIDQNQLLKPHTRIIIGFSGGPDSLFLLHLLTHLRPHYSLDLIVAHLDHGWRPESAQEATWCATIAAQLSVTFVSKKLTELTTHITHNGSREEYARRARRFFLENMRQEYSAHHIALAHHADDQEETFLIRLMRGATITGLAAMRPSHGFYIRPLLTTRKADIVSYLNSHGLTYLTDPTNTSLDFLRNRIRHIALPALANCDARFSTNMQRAIEHLQQTEQFLEQFTKTIFTHITRSEHEHLMLNVSLFNQQDPLIQYRLLMHFLIQARAPFTPSHHLLDEIIRFLTSPRGGTHHLHTHWRMVKKKSWAYITK